MVGQTAVAVATREAGGGLQNNGFSSAQALRNITWSEASLSFTPRLVQFLINSHLPLICTLNSSPESTATRCTNGSQRLVSTSSNTKINHVITISFGSFGRCVPLRGYPGTRSNPKLSLWNEVRPTHHRFGTLRCASPTRLT